MLLRGNCAVVQFIARHAGSAATLPLYVIPPPPMGFEICSALDVRVDVDDGDRVNVVEDSQKSKPEQ